MYFVSLGKKDSTLIESRVFNDKRGQNETIDLQLKNLSPLHNQNMGCIPWNKGCIRHNDVFY